MYLVQCFPGQAEVCYQNDTTLDPCKEAMDIKDRCRKSIDASVYISVSAKTQGVWVLRTTTSKRLWKNKVIYSPCGKPPQRSWSCYSCKGWDSIMDVTQVHVCVKADEWIRLALWCLIPPLCVQDSSSYHAATSTQLLTFSFGVQHCASNSSSLVMTAIHSTVIDMIAF